MYVTICGSEWVSLSSKSLKCVGGGATGEWLTIFIIWLDDKWCVSCMISKVLSASEVVRQVRKNAACVCMINWADHECLACSVMLKHWRLHAHNTHTYTHTLSVFQVEYVEKLQGATGITNVIATHAPPGKGNEKSQRGEGQCEGKQVWVLCLCFFLTREVRDSGEIGLCVWVSKKSKAYQIRWRQVAFVSHLIWQAFLTLLDCDAEKEDESSEQQVNVCLFFFNCAGHHADDAEEEEESSDDDDDEENQGPEVRRGVLLSA